MALTTYMANKILDRNYGNVNYTVPATYYIALSTTTPSSDGTGVTEPSGGNYSRVAVTNNKTNFTTAANGSLSNATQFAFPESTSSWETITHICLYDASTGGNLIAYDTLNPSRVVQSATTVLLAVGQMQISMMN
jgi:hypothetical protein